MEQSLQKLEQHLDLQYQRYQDIRRQLFDSGKKLEQQRCLLSSLKENITECQIDINVPVTSINAIHLLRLRDLIKQLSTLQIRRIQQGEQEYQQLSQLAVIEQKKFDTMKKLVERMMRKERLTLVSS